MTKVPSRSNLLQTQVSILPSLIFSSNKGFIRLKTISLQNVKSAENVFNIMKVNSESLENYKT